MTSIISLLKYYANIVETKIDLYLKSSSDHYQLEWLELSHGWTGIVETLAPASDIDWCEIQLFGYIVIKCDTLCLFGIESLIVKGKNRGSLVSSRQPTERGSRSAGH